MTQTRGISPFIIIVLIILYNESQAQPIKRIITGKPPIVERKWNRNKFFPQGGIVLVREGGLQLSETPPTMQYQFEGRAMSIGAVNDALRKISDVIEQKETSGLEEDEKSRLANETQTLKNYVQSFRIPRSNYPFRKVNEAGEYVEGRYSQEVERNPKKMKMAHDRSMSRKRNSEDIITSRHELSKLLLFLIDNNIQITPIIRDSISYWKKMLGSYWKGFGRHARGKEFETEQQPMQADYDDAQSSQQMVSGYQAPQSQQPTDASYHDAQSSQQMVSGYQAPQSQQPMDASYAQSSQQMVSGYQAPQSQQPTDVSYAQPSQQMVSGYQAPQSQQPTDGGNHDKQTNQQHHTEMNSNHIADPAALPVLPQDFVSSFLGSLPSSQPMVSGYQHVQSHQPVHAGYQDTLTNQHHHTEKNSNHIVDKIVLPPISSFLEPPPPRQT